MNSLVELWVVSGIGAVLFFAAGFCLSHILQRAEQVVQDAGQAHLRADLEHLRFAYVSQSREVEHFDQRAQRAEKSAIELSEALSHARAECVRLDRELRGQAAEVERASSIERENGSLRTELQAAAHSARNTSELRVQLLRERGHIEQLEADLHMEKSAHAALSLEIRRLKREQRERNESSRALAERLAQLEAQARESVPVKQAPALLPAGPASGFIVSRPGRSGVTYAVASPDDTLGGILGHQLALLGAHEPDVTAVLSDEQGFLLVGSGEEREQEAVSVLTSLVQDLGRRARELVELDQVELMEMVDASGRALRVRFFEWEGQPLALGFLGARSLAVSEDEERMVSSFPPLRARSA